MKSFLDRLKRKSGEADHKKKQNTLEKTPPDSTNPDSQKLADADSENAIRLELGDFLHRIPPPMVRPGPQDESLDLYFDLEEVLSMISTGRTTVKLSEIYAQIPQIFRCEQKAVETMDIRFPWQKLAGLIKAADSPDGAGAALSRSAAEALRQRMRNRRPFRGDDDGPADQGQSSVGEAGELRAIATSLNQARSRVTEQPAARNKGRGASAGEGEEVDYQAQIAQLSEDYERRLAMVTAERDRALQEIERLKSALAKRK